MYNLRHELKKIIDDIRGGEEPNVVVMGRNDLVMMLSDLLNILPDGRVTVRVPYTGYDPRKIKVHLISGTYSLRDIMNIFKE